MIRRPRSGWLLAAAAWSAALAAGPAPQTRWAAETPEVRIRLVARSPDQISGFYRARRLPEPAVEALRRACLVTVGIRNLGDRVLWLAPERWRFRTLAGREVERLSRAHWRRLWARLGVPAGARATFGWTLLPERRDLQPDEPVGGNLTLVPPAEPFVVEARFPTGRDGDGPPVVLRSPPLTCPEDAPA